MLQETLRNLVLQLPPNRWDYWLGTKIGQQIRKKKPKFRLKTGRIVREYKGTLVFHKRQLW